MNETQLQKSLILITVDCLRADHCGFHGYSRPTTPFLDSLAEESFVVPTTVVAGAPTFFSFPSILASRMPLALGRDVIGLAPGENTLALFLRDLGYATAAFSAANPYLSPHFGYDSGFDTFKDFLDFVKPPAQSAPAPSPSFAKNRGKLNRSLRGAAGRFGIGKVYDELYFQYCVRIASPSVGNIDSLREFPNAEVIVDHAISWLASATKRPFFLWLHLMDAHSPYYPSQQAFRDLTGRTVSSTNARYLNEFWKRSDLAPGDFEQKKTAIVELYDAGIRSIDSHVERLVTHLKQKNLWNSCTFVLTADHGESFLEHGRRFHSPLSLSEEIVHVPLMIRVPSIAKRIVSDAPFSHLHLAPTLLEILDLKPPECFTGVSLWRHLQQQQPWDLNAITECVYGCTNPFRAQDRMGTRLLSVRDLRHKLVMRLDSGTSEEFFDLVADPQEMFPLQHGVQNQDRKKLSRAALDHLSQTASSENLSLRLKDRLREILVKLNTAP